MKQNNIHTVLHTDVITLLHEIYFALSPPRRLWADDEHGDQAEYATSVGNANGAWSAGFLWGNCLFWTNSPTWGHSASLEGGATEAYAMAEPADQFDRS